MLWARIREIQESFDIDDATIIATFCEFLEFKGLVQEFNQVLDVAVKSEEDSEDANS